MTVIQRVLWFILVGAVAAAVNLAAMVLCTSVLGEHEAWRRNLANVFAMAVGTTAAFLLNRRWTWEDSPKKAGKSLLYQYLLYCGSASAGVALRICLFAVLDALTSIHYLLNVVVGIGSAAVLDFFLYSKFVFRSRPS